MTMATATMGSIDIHLDKKVAELFYSTRLRRCNVSQCRYWDSGNCNLKFIKIDEDGKCVQIELTTQAAIRAAEEANDET